jgi:hypothetical protein
MYPYLASELYMRQHRQQLAHTAERHRLIYSERPRRAPTSQTRRGRTAWLCRWVRPVLSPVR